MVNLITSVACISHDNLQSVDVTSAPNSHFSCCQGTEQTNVVIEGSRHLLTTRARVKWSLAFRPHDMMDFRERLTLVESRSGDPRKLMFACHDRKD